MKSLQKDLLSPSPRVTVQVFLIYMVDWQALGMSSLVAKAHARYLASQMKITWQELEGAEGTHA